MLTTLLLAALAATPRTDVRLASPGFNLVNLEEKTGDFFADYFAQQLAAQGGILVTTKSEISALLGFERQKQLLGCSDGSSSCLAELAGALGVDGLITGSIARFDKEYTVTIKIVAAADARPLGSASGRFDSERSLLDWLGSTASRLSGELKRAVRPGADAPVAQGEVKPKVEPRLAPEPKARVEPPAVAAPAPAAGEHSLFGLPVLRPVWWIPAAASVALAAGGYLVREQGVQKEKDLRAGASSVQSFGDLSKQIGEAEGWQTGGNFLLGGGGVALVLAGGFFLLGPETPRIAVVPMDGGALVSFGGAL